MTLSRKTTPVPAILPPAVQRNECMVPSQFVDIGPYLTEYRWWDDARYTAVDHQYRLRWSLRINNTWGNGLVEVWSDRHKEWHEVWSVEGVPVADTHDSSSAVKANSWYSLFVSLAEKATQVLIGGEVRGDRQF